jgi:hypothetical protein
MIDSAMKPLTEENYKEQIISMSPEDWKPLMDLIPVIEKTETFTSPGTVSITVNGILEFAPPIQVPVVCTFLEVAYQIPIIIDFDWGSWDERRNIAGDPDFDYDTVDIPTKCKLITAFVRNDRFCDGVLASCFQNGIIMKILKSIRNQLISHH